MSFKRYSNRVKFSHQPIRPDYHSFLKINIQDNGEPGRESASAIVTISSDGLCPPRQEGVLGADPFSAKIRYVDASDPDHPNTIKVSIILPHSDGILPLISTRQLTNFEFTLSQDSTRTAGHR